MTATTPLSSSASEAAPLARCAVVFAAADPPRAGRLAFWSPDGVALPATGVPGILALVPPPGDTIREVPVRWVPIADAVGLLLGADGGALAFWDAATRFALHLVARGRLLPGVSPAGFDAWRVGPLDPSDVAHLRALAAAMPAAARAVPVPGSAPAALRPAEEVLRAFLDAVADWMPRSPAAASAVGSPVFAAPAPQPIPGLRGWAGEAAAGIDAGVRVSLRVEPPAELSGAAGFRAVIQVHTPTDPTLVADAADVWAGRASGFGARGPVDAALAVRRAAGCWAPLQRLLSRAVPTELDLDDDEVTDLLAGGAAALAAAGVAVHWPRDLMPELTTRAVVGRSGTGPAGGAPGPGGIGTFTLDWEVALRGDPLTAEELDLLAAAHRPVVRLRGEWMLVDPALARRLRERPPAPLPAVKALGAALTGSVELGGEPVPVTASGALARLRSRITDDEPFAPPPDLAGTLRDYQLRGVGWLARMTELGLGGCLADDMGLGKTITVIALHLHRRALAAGPTLVVCPASLLGNWEREIARFAPGTPVRRFHGPGRTADDVAGDGIVLTTYATLRLDPAALAARPWGLLVADEAQHVKNPRSDTARSLRQVPAAARVALTGTPVENTLSDLWAILDWTTPGLLGTAAEFRRRWAEPIESGTNPEVAERFARLSGAFLLRRRKSDPGIAPELPSKTETDHPVALTREQAGLYEAVVADTMEQIARAEGMARRGVIMGLLTALKQICNHPAHYLAEARAVLAGRSGKLELLDELLDTILAEGGAVLVFTQYVAMARLLEGHLGERGVETLLLHGGTPVRRREEMVAAFQRGDAPVFLLSLKAAGTGLNLTRADHVVHVDRWWNPAVEEQATDRAHRIGQTRPVQVHRLIAEGTLEDRIAVLLDGKRALAGAVLGAGEAALTELTNGELADLVELRGGR